MQQEFSLVRMTDREFARLSSFIEGQLGIKMPEAKKTLLETRLQKRLRHHRFKTFREYCDYLFSPSGERDEMVTMMDLTTTNKTDFFREPDHFDYLLHHVVPVLTKARKHLTIWSAACSSGEEPYTIAMVLDNYREQHPGFHYSILATDISTKVLGIAERGIYHKERIIPIPTLLRKKYILKHKDPKSEAVRVIPRLREAISYRRVNLLDETVAFREPMDVIFCRNVFIYFDKETQESIVRRFHRYLARGGYLFIGHSETLNGMDVPFTRASNAVFRKE